MQRYRTHTCGQLRPTHIGQQVVLSGWVAKIRELGGIHFLVLRDHYGRVQLVMEDLDDNCVLDNALDNVRVEATIRVEGIVRARPEGTFNQEMQTGQIEVVIRSIEVLGASAPLPFTIDGKARASEQQRLKHRYLDLRQQKLHHNIAMRSKITNFLRQAMIARDFTEVQTPILTASSPEGARDYLVPARLHPGKFYALPQAPQQFKQLLMASGFDRYFQIAPCFRDEAGRADRSPGEFYQLDLEMAFVTQEEIFEVVEGVMIETFTEFSDYQLPHPFPHLTWHDAMNSYGSDKPDLRFEMRLQHVTEALQRCGVDFIEEKLAAGESAVALVIPDAAGEPRSYFLELDKYIRGLGSSPMAWVTVKDDGSLAGSIGKKLNQDARQHLSSLEEVSPGAAICLVFGKHLRACQVAGKLRSKLGVERDLIEHDIFRFAWIVDFPMYEEDEETGEIVFSHNPFSMPQGGLEALETKSPLDILAYQYDLVCNGLELSSGAIRNHRRDIMERAFSIAGYPREELEQRFGALYEAFAYGPPPHGGIAPGIERILMLLLDEPNIRDVVAFPMNQRAQDLLMGSPSEVTKAQLDELHITTIKPRST